MPWNKTAQETIDAIMQDMRKDFSQRYCDLARKHNVSEWLVSELARKHLTKEERKQRYSDINKHAKLKSNPMKGKTREKHHNSKEEVMVAGYMTEWAPSWLTGKTPKGNRCYVHQRVWCEYNGKTEVPSGYVIHHLDENKLNNDPSNLVCLTRREHAQIHCVNNILKRCNDYPQGVEGSALEAQRLLIGV